MSTVKWSASFSTSFNNLYKKELREAAAEAIIEAVEWEFHNLLIDAPQWSGNYVANMKLEAATQARTKAQEYFDEPESVTAAYQRGELAAVMIAKKENAEFGPKLKARLLGSGGAGWLPPFIVYNPLDYASYVEEGSKLRPVNKPGAHAIEKMADRLNAAQIKLKLRRDR